MIQYMMMKSLQKIDEINFLQDLVYNDGNGIIEKKKKIC